MSLDPTADEATGATKATSITSAELLDSDGASVARATINQGAAVFELTAVSAGDYFIKVNGDADDLVPTRIDNPTVSVTQRVGEKLRVSYIGPQATPVYHINTYSAGQSLKPTLRYSDGTPVAGAQPYLICTLGTPKVELRILGTGALLTSIVPAAMHPANAAPFDSWMINTTGKDHHGDAFKSEGGPPTCLQCHSNYATRPASFAETTPVNGWCFHCHNGPAGSGAGFVDPTQ